MSCRNVLWAVTYNNGKGAITDYVVAPTLNRAAVLYGLLAPTENKLIRIDRAQFPDAHIYVDPAR